MDFNDNTNYTSGSDFISQSGGSSQGFDISSGGGYSQKPSGLTIASMILGIVSLVFCCFWYITLATSITGLVLGIIGLRKTPEGAKGMGKAGVIMSAVALGLAVIWMIVGIAIACNPYLMEELLEELY